jgi:hypothetical protein
MPCNYFVLRIELATVGLRFQTGRASSVQAIGQIE